MADALDAFLDQVTARSQRNERADRASLPGSVAAVLNGLTFGFGDEATAGVRSLFGSTSYDDALAEERANLARYREQRPWLSAGLELAGSAPTMLIPGLGAARAAQAGSRLYSAVRAGAAAGAAGGALSGIGEGEGALGRTVGGAVGAGVGALAGGAGAAALEAAAPVVRGVIDRFRSPETAARRQMARVVERGHPEPGAARSAVEEAAAARSNTQAAGLPDDGQTLAEVLGPGATAQLDALAQRPGQAMEEITRQLDARRAGRMGRVEDALRATFGDAEDAYTRSQALYAQRSQQAGPVYRQAFDGAAALGLDDIALLGRVPRAAVAEANEIAGMRGGRLSFEPEFDANGFLVPRAGGRLPTAEDMHHIRVGLDSLVQRNTNEAGRPNALAVAAAEVRDRLRDRLDDLTRQPDGSSLYQQARQLWAGPTANNDALNLGRRLFEEDPARLRDLLGRMSEPERDHFLQGGMNALRVALSRVNQNGAANPLNAIWANEYERQRVGVLTEALGLAPEEAARRFRDLANYFTRENAGLQTENAVQRNSATARRQAYQRDLAPVALGGAAGTSLGVLTGNDPWTSGGVGMAVGGARAGGRYVARSIAEATNDHLGRMLGTADPARQRAIMAEVDRLLQQMASRQQGLSPQLRARAGLLSGTGPFADDVRRGLME